MDYEIERLIKWLYKKRVLGGKASWLNEVYDRRRHGEWVCEDECAMVRRCILGDRFEASVFRRASERTFVDCFLSGSYQGCHAYPQTVILAFANLPPSSPILRFLIDLQCENFDKKSLSEPNYRQYRHSLSVDFLLGAMERYMKIDNGAKATLQACD